MKTIISLFLAILLMTGNTFAATGSGNVTNVVNLGGINSTSNLAIPESNSQNYITLSSNAAGTAGNFYPLYKNGAAYQVTAGKTFYVTKVCVMALTTANSTLQLLSATASFAYGATSLTGGVFQGGASTPATQLPLYTGTTAGAYQCYDMSYQFAASTYPGWESGGSVTYSIYVTGAER